MIDLAPGEYQKIAAEHEPDLDANQKAALAAYEGKRSYLLRTKIDDEAAPLFIVRPPSRQEYDRFMKSVSSKNEDQEAAAHRNFMVWCTLYPSKVELASWCMEYPGTPFVVSSALAKISGFGEASQKK